MSYATHETEGREQALQLEVSESHLAERTQQLKASEGHLAERTLQLDASESHLAESGLQLDASESHLAERTLQLDASESQLAERTLQLDASESHLAESTLQLDASESHLAERTLQLDASESQLAERTLQLGASENHLAESIARLKSFDTPKQADKEREDLISVLNDALSGKTVLLQEVHHRVKNNLALITALLEMQADTLDDERAITALRESQQRVMSMALIHEYLYGNEHLDRVNFGLYMEQLTGQLCASYAIEGDLVSIRIAAEDIDLPMQRAIPCGLIVNELLTNAVKHAYARGHRGEIIIQLVRLESGKLMLSCQDRGKGIPESFDWKNSTSLGLRIIQILTKQLDGELKLDRSGGTRFELVFQASAVDS